MAPKGVLLEQTLSRVDHPENLDAFHMPGRIRIDDPLVEPIQKGEPVLGWEGDIRLAVYLNVPERRWELWRLEAEGIYRCNYRLMADGVRGPQITAELIRWLLNTDSRRGADMLVQLDQAEAAKERSDEAQYDDLMDNEVIPRMRHEFRKAGLHHHL